jgi:hypothetical protein
MVAMLMLLTVVVDHYATAWWVTLHQNTTLFKPSPTVHGWQLASMGASFVGFGLLFAWMMVHRYRLEQLEDRYETEGLTAALLARRSEAPEPAGARVPRARPAGTPPVVGGVAVPARQEAPGPARQEIPAR